MGVMSRGPGVLRSQTAAKTTFSGVSSYSLDLNLSNNRLSVSKQTCSKSNLYEFLYVTGIVKFKQPKLLD